MNQREFAAIFAEVQGHWHLDPIPVEALDTYLSDLGEFEAAQVAAAVQALAREGKPRVPLAGQIRRKIVELQLDPPQWPVALRQLKDGSRWLDDWRPPAACLDGNPECAEGWVETPETYELSKNVPCECSPNRIDRRRKLHLIRDGRMEPCTLGVCDGTGYVRKTEEAIHNVTRPCSCRGKLVELRQPPLHRVVRVFAELVGWDEIRRMLLGDSTMEAQMRTKYEHVLRDQIDMLALRGLHAPGMPKLDRAEGLDRPAISRRGEMEKLSYALPAG